jgi:hypothetical protein
MKPTRRRRKSRRGEEEAVYYIAVLYELIYCTIINLLVQIISIFNRRQLKKLKKSTA